MPLLDAIGNCAPYIPSISIHFIDVILCPVNHCLLTCHNIYSLILNYSLILIFNFVSIIRVSSFKLLPIFCKVLSNFNRKNTATKIGKPTVLIKFSMSIKKRCGLDRTSLPSIIEVRLLHE